MADLSHVKQTVSGIPARVLATDLRSEDGASVCAVIVCPCCGNEEPHLFFADGRFFSGLDRPPHGMDIFDLDTRVLN